MIYWIIFFFIIEYYSIAVCIEAKKHGAKNYMLNLIPFVAYFYVQKRLKTIHLFTIPSKKMGLLMVVMFIVAAISSFFYVIGTRYYSNPLHLQQILYLPLGFSMFLLVITSAKSMSDLLFEDEFCFAGITFTCLFILPMPFYCLKIKKNENKGE